MKIAIIWGYSRSEILWGTHHQFWEAALRQFPNIEVVRYTWDNWQTMPQGFDLYFFVDFHPSLFRVAHTKYHPRVFYWFDSFHHSFTYPAQLIECFDRSYFAEMHAVKALNSLGVSKVTWLPAAYHPVVYHPISADKLHDYAFVGQPDDVVIRKGLTRKEFITRFQLEKLNGYVGQGVYGQSVNQIYNETKVLVDRSIYCNIGTRFFETIGSGGFLLVNRGLIPSGIDELAMDGAHFVSYDDSFEDCLSKMKFYLDNSNERERIARNGQAFFLKNHTYEKRLLTILSDVGLQ